MRIGFLEPHLGCFGGIRRILEFSNRLSARGHEATIYVPDDQPLHCDWMPCAAPIKHVSTGLKDPLDVLLFNNEPQWYLIDLFVNAQRRAFYALHDGSTYGKEGSWEAARADVDLILANSSWTAARISAQTDRDVPVVLGGINPQHFRPLAVPKRYPILAVGDRRWWKGHDTIQRAADRLGLPVETYVNKGLSQERMAEEYSAAKVFVVGSVAEGFGQPGLEALACGVPLVTTANGGASEYALDGETALVVPPGDEVAMASAIERLLTDDALAQRLAANGLEHVRQVFDWDRNTERLEEMLRTVLREPQLAPTPRSRPASPLLSVIVLAWDQLTYTQRCVETLRRHTDVEYELIIVDNGSSWDARHYAERAADVAVLHDENRGFAAGMNAGAAAAKGRYVAFCNNDTEFPPKWASRLIETHENADVAGITVPAVTEAQNGRTVRSEPGTRTETLDPFEPAPAAVVYLIERETIEALGGWGEEFQVASGEDVDLAFKVWVNGLDIVLDTRVLVDHVGKGTAAVKLPDWRAQWAANGRVFLEKWSGPDLEVPRLPTCDPAAFDRNVATARSVAGWMQKYYQSLERSLPGKRFVRWLAARVSVLASSAPLRDKLGPAWITLAPRLPRRWRDAIEMTVLGRADRVAMVSRRNRRRS